MDWSRQGRQYSDGLHQAIEAKEGVPIQQATATIATTTYQNFFRKYDKFSGMTGTAYTEKKEFKHTYGLDTVVIPTNKPVIRVDRPDVIYITKEGKYKGVVEEVKKTHAKGQPILIGTVSVRTSEEVSDYLDHEGIPHQVLNAKQDAEEANIIALAGKYGAVTVATNMAGRGTDIILDDKAKAAGGLKVIGTERHLLDGVISRLKNWRVQIRTKNYGKSRIGLAMSGRCCLPAMLTSFVFHIMTNFQSIFCCVVTR